jgi:hypothetical protein
MPQIKWQAGLPAFAHAWCIARGMVHSRAGSALLHPEGGQGSAGRLV